MWKLMSAWFMLALVLTLRLDEIKRKIHCGWWKCHDQTDEKGKRRACWNAGQWWNELLQLKKLNVKAAVLNQDIWEMEREKRGKRWISQPSMVPSWNAMRLSTSNPAYWSATPRLLNTGQGLTQRETRPRLKHKPAHSSWNKTFRKWDREGLLLWKLYCSINKHHFWLNVSFVHHTWSRWRASHCWAPAGTAHRKSSVCTPRKRANFLQLEQQQHNASKKHT